MASPDSHHSAPTNPGSANAGPATSLPTWLRSQLRCPVTGEELVDGFGPDGVPVLVSRGAGLSYPVRDGVPVLLPHESLGA
ncbi:Trm112 family protein [Actinomyces trachealis]|uniref:Trm112 family protein n=1 Tax=Actinomyces trachealis TaxID=2763540 RepID=UPI001892B58B|nr:hypothetical protein [Actinomyces trachealis]